jgi:hypothetical protein
MTEQEWHDCAEPEQMLPCLLALSGRKQRLCAAACARSILPHAATNIRMQHYATSETMWFSVSGLASLHRQLNAAELFADGLIDRKIFRGARQVSGGPHNVFHSACRMREFSLQHTISCLHWFREEFGAPTQEETCSVMRDIAGNPFWPVGLESRWQTSNVLDLVRTIYDEKAFDRLPILADALMDAGCDSDAILEHCRSTGPHVRGCYVVDLLVGRE